MVKPQNKYRPSTIAYRLLSGKWDNMDVVQIADELCCSVKTIYHNFSMIKLDQGYIVKRRDRRWRHTAAENGNIYLPGSKLWRLYEGDWSGVTKDEIAKKLNSTKNTVIDYIRKIEEETGKRIDFLDGRTARRRRRGQTKESIPDKHDHP